MAEATKKPSRIALLAVCAAALSAGLIVGVVPAAVAQNQPPAQQPKKPKKLPPGARGFENYATRDASDKLATGGATRDPITDEFKATMKEGQDLYEAGKYKEAAQHFARASKMKPDVFRAFYSLGAAHEAAGQFKEAAAAYKTAVALKPDTNDEPNSPLLVKYALANSQAAAGQHADAVNVYSQIIDQIGRDSGGAARPYYNLALSLDALGRQQEAIDAYQQSASAFAKAVEEATKAVEAGEVDPKVLTETKNAEAQTHYNLGVMHSRAERYGEAVESFKRALASRPDYTEALYNLGLAYYLMDNNAGLVEQQKKLKAMNSPLASELAKLAGR